MERKSTVQPEKSITINTFTISSFFAYVTCTQNGCLLYAYNSSSNVGKEIEEKEGLTDAQITKKKTKKQSNET